MTNEVWRDWSKYVLKTIEKLENKHSEQEQKIHNLESEIKLLKWKIGIFGFIGSSLPVIAHTLFQLAK